MPVPLGTNRLRQAASAIFVSPVLYPHRNRSHVLHAKRVNIMIMSLLLQVFVNYAMQANYSIKMKRTQLHANSVVLGKLLWLTSVLFAIKQLLLYKIHLQI